MKRVIYIFIVLSIIIGGLFAIFEDKIFSDIPKDVIENLESRYPNDNFKFIEYCSDKNTENSRVMKVKGNYGEFIVTRYYDYNDEVHYNDNYLGYIYKDKIVEDLNKALRIPLYDKTAKFFIDLDSSSFPDSTDKSIPYEELITMVDTSIKVNIVSTFEWKDETVEGFVDMLDMSTDMKVVATVLECDELIDLKDFESVLHSDESLGKRVHFSVGYNKEILYINRE